MKLFSSLFLIIGFVLTAICQEQPKDITVWLPSDQCKVCDSVIVDGKTFRIIDDGQRYIALYPSYEDGYWVGLVVLINKTSDRFDFEPLKHTGVLAWKTEKEYLAGANPTVYPAIAPESIAKDIERRAFWSNALRSFGAGMQTQTATVQTTIPGTIGVMNSTVTVPDDAARQKAAQENAKNSARSTSASSQLMGEALKANTIFPADKVFGNVYYKRNKKMAVIAFNFVLAKHIYSFVYNGSK